MKTFPFFLILHVLVLVVYWTAQGQSPAQQLESMVNDFTGDFHYSVPLLTVPGPNGEAFPLTANYSGGGVGMNQDASWLGLGWSMSVGEIHRSVNGIPDDWKGGVAEDILVYAEGNLEVQRKVNDYFGPVHFKEIYDHDPVGLLRKADVYATMKGAQGAADRFSFQAPDYDDYNVSGPGIGGPMQPFLFQYKSLFKEDKGLSLIHSASATANRFTERPRFRFLNEDGAKVRADYYGGDGPKLWHQLSGADDLSAAYMYFKSPDEIPDDFVDESPDGDARWAANHIEYFTNEEISIGVDGFLEYKSGIDRSSNDYEDFEKDGIGAFRITSPHGLTYHYSLPVYADNEMMQHFTLEYNGSGYDPIIDDNTYPISIKRKKNRYATTWKLTAITGSGYVDNIPLGSVGPEDRGYWIRIDYEKWNKTPFEWRMPYYGYNFDQQVKRPEWGQLGRHSEYESTGTVSSGQTELYYPKCIRTSSHVAYFVYSVRLDAHSVKAGGLVTPRLGLNKIVLLNTDYDEMFSSLSTITSPEGFTDLGTVANLNALVSTKHYTDNQEDIEAVSLATVEFEQDYSLCQGIYDNVNADVETTSEYLTVLEEAIPMTFPQEENTLYQGLVSTQTTSVDASGKLTLKEIKHFGDQHGNFAPSYVFHYSDINPFYDHRRKNFFGHYKLNHDPIGMGGYITTKNDEYKKMEAWSLKKVITPMGAEVEVSYESDVYDKVCYDNTSGDAPQSPTHIFLVKDFVTDGTVQSFTLFDQDGYHYFGESDRVLASGMGVRLGCPYDLGVCTWSLPGASVLNLPELHEALTYSGNPSSGFNINPPFPQCQVEEYDIDCMQEDFYGPASDRIGTAYIGFRMKHAYGGGLRVNTISIREPELEQAYKLNYTYTDGILTTEPDRFEKNGFDNSVRMNVQGSDRHAQAPTVGYSRVDCSIVGDNDQVLGKTVKEFNNHVNDLLPSYHTYLYTDDGELEEEEVILYDPNVFFGVSVVNSDDLAGKIKSHSIFDGNGISLQKTLFGYERLGGTDEVFYERTVIPYSAPPVQSIFNQIAYVKRHRTMLVSNITKIIGDQTITQQILQRDALTGLPTLVKNSNLSDGIELSKSDFAWSHFPSMGSKYLDLQNQNMLVAESGMTTYENTESVSTIRDAAVQDWSNSHDYWSWNGDDDRYERSVGFEKYMVEESRVYNGETAPEDWKMVSRTTLLDATGKVVEQCDAEGRFSAIKYGYESKHVVAKVSNGNFHGFTHTSFESVTNPEGSFFFFEGGVLQNDAEVIPSTPLLRAHTGDNLIRLAGEDDPVYTMNIDDDDGRARGLEPGRKYHASVWVHVSSWSSSGLKMELKGTWSGGGPVLTRTMLKSDQNALTLGQWKRLDVTLTIPDDYEPSVDDDLTVTLFGGRNNRPSYFDDLRVHPIDAAMEGMVYDDRTGRLTFSLNNDNVATKYEYDAAGNVIKVFTEQENGFVKQMETLVNFGRED